MPLLLIAACQRESFLEVQGIRLPIPPNVKEVRTLELVGGQTQVSFVEGSESVSSGVRDFYAAWASRNGWVEIPRTEGLGGVGEWEAYGHSQEPWLVLGSTWRDPTQTTSLFLVGRQKSRGSPIEIFLVISPYTAASPADEEVMTVQELKDALGERLHQ